MGKAVCIAFKNITLEYSNEEHWKIIQKKINIESWG